MEYSKEICDGINQLLALWNPISVPEYIADVEYTMYVPEVYDSLTDRETLLTCLESILVKKIGLSYDKLNADHVADLNSVCDKLISLKGSKISR